MIYTHVLNRGGKGAGAHRIRMLEVRAVEWPVSAAMIVAVRRGDMWIPPLSAGMKWISLIPATSSPAPRTISPST